MRENDRPGDESWWSTQHAPAGAIEGYASWPSLLAGDRLELHVSTRPAARYRVVVHRLGWYGGAGGRLVAVHPADGGDGQGLAREAPAVLAGPQLPSAGWPVTDVILTGPDWPTGQYVARLVLTSGEHAGHSSVVPFVVRDRLDRRADVLVQMPVTTAQAYNGWGGKGLYDSVSADGVRAVKVSFDRPIPFWHEANINARWPFLWDVQLLRFLEREGYDVAYTTDLDTHRAPWALLGHPLVVTSGHDEYWSREMRDGFEALVASGASVACMGSNTAYWQMRLEDGDRTMVCYRISESDPEPDPARKTILFRDLVPPRPEAALLGVQYDGGLTLPDQPPRHYSLVPAALGDRWLEGTGFKRGAVLEDLVGYEWDALAPGVSPRDATVFFRYEHPESDAHCVRWRTAAGGLGFAAGSLQFSWGLDDWAYPGHADARLQRFMRNAFDELIASGRERLDR